MIETGVIGGICHAIHRYAKNNIKYRKESSYLKYWYVNNVYDG